MLKVRVNVMVLLWIDADKTVIITLPRARLCPQIDKRCLHLMNIKIFVS